MGESEYSTQINRALWIAGEYILFILVLFVTSNLSILRVTIGTITVVLNIVIHLLKFYLGFYRDARVSQVVLLMSNGVTLFVIINLVLFGFI